MKARSNDTTGAQLKLKRPKKTLKKLSAVNIAERYLELRHLRKRLSDAEASRGLR